MKKLVAMIMLVVTVMICVYAKAYTTDKYDIYLEYMDKEFGWENINIYENGWHIVEGYLNIEEEIKRGELDAETVTDDPLDWVADWYKKEVKILNNKGYTYDDMDVRFEAYDMYKGVYIYMLTVTSTDDINWNSEEIENKMIMFMVVE